MQKLSVSRRKILLAKLLIWGGLAITLTAIPFVVSKPHTFFGLIVAMVIVGLLITFRGVLLSANLFRCPCCGHALQRSDSFTIHEIINFDDLPEYCSHCNWKVDVDLRK